MWAYVTFPVTDEIKRISDGYDINKEWKFDPVCTCGATKACAPYPASGHSSWCDINNPPPETEEFPF